MSGPGGLSAEVIRAKVAGPHQTIFNFTPRNEAVTVSAFKGKIDNHCLCVSVNPDACVLAAVALEVSRITAVLVTGFFVLSSVGSFPEVALLEPCHIMDDCLKFTADEIDFTDTCGQIDGLSVDRSVIRGSVSFFFPLMYFFKSLNFSIDGTSF